MNNPSLFRTMWALVWMGAAVAASGGEKPKEKAPPLQDIVLPDLPAQAQADDGGARTRTVPSQTFYYQVKRKVLITPDGQLDQENTKSTVDITVTPTDVLLVWERGSEAVYTVSGHEPIAIETPAGRRWVTTLRAYRKLTTGSIEQIVMTSLGFVLTSPAATSLNTSVIHAEARVAPATAAPIVERDLTSKSQKTASLFP